ncbi:S-adenosylmethionine transporter [Clarireedia jacksonii]
MTQSSFTPALLAGALAGTTVDLTLFPLDTLKTRLQSSAGFLASGGFSGVYRGVGSAIIGSAPGAALFFCTYEYTKTALARRQELLSGGGVHAGNKALEHMLAASLGEVAACAVRVPTEVVKQRAQAGQHASSLLTLKAILGQYRYIGLRGFPLWESMKAYRRGMTGREGVSAMESGAMGSVAGAVAAGITTPLDVLKTRMMLAREKQGMGFLLRDILRTNGPSAFFAGIGPRVLWISVGGAIFLGSYQWAYNELSGEGRD